tara:strand:+ start:115 stop:1401 length:1287 start_codon:yes stop_codon:yes gene_type:complete
MKFVLMHPRDQLIMIMSRIYGYGMTTTSGGNLSILDEEGNLWITPAGIDKGELKPEDIICVKRDGSIEGIHKPSSEYPFHLAIYKARKDIKAILHAHPSPLVAFSIAKKLPDTKVIPQALDVCGKIGFADYAIPGSEELGANIAKKFEEGFDTVVLENHGAVTGGKDLFETFKQFETLNFTAKIILKSKTLGKHNSLSEEQIKLFYNQDNKLEEFEILEHSNDEKRLRKKMCGIIKRAYSHRLMTSTEGTVSTRVNGNTFLITPHNVDRKYMQEEDIVMIKDGKCEKGKTPSKAVLLHAEIYKNNPDTNSIISAQPPNIMAFSITGTKFDTHVIPESYVVLRDIPLVEYKDFFTKREEVSKMFSEKVKVILVKNDSLLVTGDSLLECFDRLEVAEFSAKSVINASFIGDMIPIDDEEIKKIDKVFLGL